MTQETDPRYTMDEVLDGLRAIACEVAGRELVVDPKMRIDHFLAMCAGVSPGDADDADLEDMWDMYYYRLYKSIDRLFHLDTTQEAVTQWLTGDAKSPDDWRERVAPQRTIEKLAAIIVLHSRRVSFEPVTILGRYCAPAGAFFGMEDVAYAQQPGLERFAPSTPIRDRLRGSELSRFWNRVRFCSGRRIPDIVDPESSGHWSWKYANLVTLLFLPVLILETVFWVGIIPRGMVSDWVPPLGGIVLGLVLAVRARIRVGRVLAHFSNPLPRDIHTFRDLAELIVRHRESDAATA